MFTNILLKKNKKYSLHYCLKNKFNKKYKKLVKYNKYIKKYNPRLEFNIFSKVY